MFYHPGLSFEDNYRIGPFNMREVPEFDFAKYRGNFSFLGFTVDIPFGIAAGPLLTSRHIKSAWSWGFSLSTYKTVRSRFYPCHPFPNVLKVKSQRQEIRPGEVTVGLPDITRTDFRIDSITNSFGVPSQEPKVWQTDVTRALTAMEAGKIMILSFMGTKKSGMTRDEFIEDYAKTCRLAKETGAPVLEINLSCPNVGREGLVCFDEQTSRAVLETVKPICGNAPLLVKIGYFPENKTRELGKILEAIADNANGVVSINTIQAKVTDRAGRQALPGNADRLLSGICGPSIRWAGLAMARRIIAYKNKRKWRNLVVVGVGGVVSAADFRAYLKVGVDAVQTATGAMFCPTLAMEVRREMVKPRQSTTAVDQPDAYC